MGLPSFFLIDRDKVDTPNIATQAYYANDVAKYKTAQLEKHLGHIAPDGAIRVACFDGEFRRMPRVYTDEEEVRRPLEPTLVISSVDNIETRREVLHYCEETSSVRLLVDPRMGLELLEVHFVDMELRDSAYTTYKTCLEDEAQDYSEDPCGARAIAGTGMLAASVICSGILRHMIGHPFPKMLVGHLGRMEMKPYWREGEEFVDKLPRATVEEVA
jgi:hypothetical protein